jgi:hypothetical protein
LSEPYLSILLVVSLLLALLYARRRTDLRYTDMGEAGRTRGGSSYGLSLVKLKGSKPDYRESVENMIYILDNMEASHARLSELDRTEIRGLRAGLTSLTGEGSVGQSSLGWAFQEYSRIVRRIDGR